MSDGLNDACGATYNDGINQVWCKVCRDFKYGGPLGVCQECYTKINKYVKSHPAYQKMDRKFKRADQQLKLLDKQILRLMDKLEREGIKKLKGEK